MTRTIIMIGLAGLLSGCGAGDWFKSIAGKKKVDYKTSRAEKPLEVPPDLTAPTHDNRMAVPGGSTSGTATYSGYKGTQKKIVVGGKVVVLPDQSKIRFVRDRDRFWLVIQGEPAQVWARVRTFWLRNGFLLRIDNPTIGIMETDWAENRANIPDGTIRRILSNAVGGLYSWGTRDKFRVRLERGSKPGTTELYLTHKGMKEIVQGDGLNPEGTVWTSRKTDHELEIEMLKLLMVHIGVEKQRAAQVVASGGKKKLPQAQVFRNGDGSMTLLMNEPYSRAWRIAGLALDRVGFVVEDRNRSKGVYQVRYQDPAAGTRKKKSFFGKLLFWRSDKKPEPQLYQVYLKPEGTRTRVVVLDKNGKRDNSDTAKRILSLMYDQLK